MNKSLIIVLLFVMLPVLGFSQAVAQSEELSVINDTFLELIGTDYYLMPLPTLPYAPIHPDSIDAEIIDDKPITIELDGVEYPSAPPFNQDSLREAELKEYDNFDWDNYYQKIKEIKSYLKNRPLDTANLIVIVNDSLVDYPDNRISKYILTEKGFKENFDVGDSWRSLAVKLVDSLNQTVHLPLSTITNTGKYNLVNSGDYNKAANDRVVGFVRITRVSFNEQKNRACFIFSFICGGECGSGVMVFAERINAHWVIVGQRELWVS